MAQLGGFVFQIFVQQSLWKLSYFDLSSRSSIFFTSLISRLPVLNVLLRYLNSCDFDPMVCSIFVLS
ncbi:hypothetical protein BEN74_00290 (plasmid) [Acinetobacter sp. WCHAc010034]|nr:hypothetical protein BEN74_00290 [Acinetobacter sp. WCHAc010034]